MTTRDEQHEPARHGGDLRRMGREAGLPPEAILDFSVNVRPEGPPEFITAALWRAMNTLAAYPSPRAEEAVEAAARRHGFPVGSADPAGSAGAAPGAPALVFGNGSNELLHALMRALAREQRRAGRAACLNVAEPAFAEYAVAGRAAGLEVRSVPGDALFRPDWDALTAAPAGSAVILANPGNPSGVFTPPAACAAAMDRRPDLAWIVDEAFIDYAGDGWDASPDAVSLLPLIPTRPNWVVLRSLTKFYAVPGLRLGYAAAGADLARRLAAELPVWNVNAFALAAALAVFQDRSDFAAATRQANRERRADLARRLARLPVQVFPSEANYLLFRWQGEPDRPPHRLAERLLAGHGIALRDCSDYHGLEDGSWFRAAVRLPEDHERLVLALAETAGVRLLPDEAAGSPVRPAGSRRRPALMLQGASSDAGKSVLAAAFCRILRQDGHDVAPFKAQNMSLNSGVTAAGAEMGRAQIVQALACGLEPDARMNPILLKPQSETGSQVILLGEAVARMNARDYMRAKRDFWPQTARAYDELAAEHEVMVLEGAGSPAEINLKDGDLVNMRMAAHANAAVLLTGDIDRGGVYAALLGTWMTFTPAEQRLVAGFLVNRFRGDASLLAPAHDILLQRTGRPVFGVIPYLRDIGLPEEDSASLGRLPIFRAAGSKSPQHESPQGSPQGRPLDVAVILLRHVSNHTDFAPLALEPDVRLRAVRRVGDWGEPDMIILPGSRSVAADLAALRAEGLDRRILDHAARDGWIFGICGGLQMLGTRLLDPAGVESAETAVQGLGLLDIETTLGPRKTLIRVDRAETPLGVPCSGYEIHHGRTTRAENVAPAFRRTCGPNERGEQEDADSGVCGYARGRRWATYLHGVFDDDAFRRAFLDHVRRDLGLDPLGRVAAAYDVNRALDRLADVVRERVDLDRIYRSMGLR